MFSLLHAAKAILDRSVKHSRGMTAAASPSQIISGRTTIERSAPLMRLPDRRGLCSGRIKHRWRPAVRDLGRGLVGFQFTFDSVNGAGADPRRHSDFQDTRQPALRKLFSMHHGPAGAYREFAVPDAPSVIRPHFALDPMHGAGAEIELLRRA